MARIFKTGITADGDVSTKGFLKSTNSSGDEGGQIDLTKPATNTSITTGVTIDLNQNLLRFFETGGTNRGYYIDVTLGGANVGTNLVSGGSYTLPAATSTALGGIELFSDTAQTTASNAVTTTASRTYGLQVNASGQGVINVPWTDTDTNTFPTTWSWSAGTTSGPTASITGTSSTISVAAIPAAAAGASGIVTTGSQVFAGAKNFANAVTFDSAVISVGKTSSPTEQVFGYYLATDGAVIACRSAATPLYSHMIGASGTVTMLQFIYNGTTNGTIRVASGGTPAFASGSDYRIKTDVTPITNAIERMKNAKAYTFYKNEEIDPSHTLHTGFLAHELADVQPDAVLGEKDEVDENGAPVYQEVMEAKIIPVMAQAINDLIGMVETLTARIEALEA
jgi:hypothetical protein